MEMYACQVTTMLCCIGMCLRGDVEQDLNLVECFAERGFLVVHVLSSSIRRYDVYCRCVCGTPCLEIAYRAITLSEASLWACAGEGLKY